MSIQSKADVCYWGTGCAPGPRMCSFCKSHDRDSELAALRMKLDDALKVVEAARAVRHKPGIGHQEDDALDDAVDDYIAKHGAK